MQCLSKMQKLVHFALGIVMVVFYLFFARKKTLCTGDSEKNNLKINRAIIG